MSQTKRQVHQNKINMNSDWQLQAACRSTPDTDDFFDTREPYLRALSKKYCQSCPVRAQCLYVSLVNDDTYGLWGSLTPKQRRFYMREIYSYAQDRNISILDWSNELDEIFQLFSTTSRLSQHF